MNLLKRCFCAVFLIFWLPAEGSLVMPGDGPYYRLSKDRSLYIYDEIAREWITDLAAFNEAVRANYDNSFAWKLDEEMDLILASSRQQVPNAFATTVPNIKTFWYPAGGTICEEAACSSWAQFLAMHEGAHLYQLNAKGEFASALSTVFGNSVLLLPLPILPLFLHPNYLTPTFIVEGNAVMNESRFNMGGRLHSGEKRALVFTQIAAGDIDPARLINDDFRFPYGEESYFQGAYFQAHLAAKYGVDKTNQFFKEHGRRYFVPLRLNKTFRDHFGNSYPQEIREYVRGLEGLAKKQVRTTGKTIVDTVFADPMNHDDRRIFFLTTKGEEPPLLHVLDRATKKVETRQMDLLRGKVFFDGDRVLTAATDQQDLHHVTYSLYGEHAAIDPRFENQIVNDQRAGKTVALSATESWGDPKILVNGEAMDFGHSQPILDREGRVYYFRQNGTERMLYRDRELITKFEGFYAKATEVTPDGTFYFIGNTDYGSSLFRLRGKEITRVLASDRVIDARWVEGDDFLVTEVNSQGHLVMLTKAQPSNQLPATYSYGFPNQNLSPPPAMTKEAAAAEEDSYNSFGQMRYSYLEFLGGYSGKTGLQLGAQSLFTDPLEYQAVSAGWVGSEFGDKQASAKYSFTKYLPDFFALYAYEEDTWEDVNDRKRRAYDHFAGAGVELPLLRWRRWDAVTSVAALYEHQDAQGPDVEEYYSIYSHLGLKYEIPTPLGFYSWRAFSLNYVNHLKSEPNSFTKKHNTSLAEASYVHGFGAEFYLTAAARYAWAETHDIKVTGDLSSLSQDIRVGRLTSHNEDYLVKQAGSLRLEFTKSILLPAYSARIPIGVNRVAPVVVAQGLIMDQDPRGVYPPDTFEWGYGADVELLLLHRAAARVRYLQSYDTHSPQDLRRDDKVQFSMKTTF